MFCSSKPLRSGIGWLQAVQQPPPPFKPKPTLPALSRTHYASPAAPQPLVGFAPVASRYLRTAMRLNSARSATHCPAACGLSGESLFGSPSSDWREMRTVETE